MIRPISSKDDFNILAQLLNDSFITIANEFGLTRENCASNNAFVSASELERKLIPGREFYCLYIDKKPIGIVAIEKSLNKKDTFYIENLGVHPDYRHKGYGKQLMNFAETRIKELGGYHISIGLINKNRQLKEWYKAAGYTETDTKEYPHLPFIVCLMSKKYK